MPTVTISLPDALKSFLDRQLAVKGFGNVSEYFRSLLRQAQAEEEETRLEKLLLEGLNGNRDISLSPEFWTDLKAEAVQITQNHKPNPKS